jgi:DNA-binding PucR family transcriptional regulator
MINTIYTNILQSRNKQNVQEFCDSFGVDGYWVNDLVYRIDVSESQRIQFKLSLSSFESDLGSNVCSVSGIKDDVLMLVALDCATRYALGKMADLSDVLLMCVWNKDMSLISATNHKLKDLSPEIIDTLKMYFYTGYNAVLAAEQLYLHRNTFSYRLNKFVDKTDMDIKNKHIAQFLYQYFLLNDRL